MAEPDIVSTGLTAGGGGAVALLARAFLDRWWKREDKHEDAVLKRLDGLSLQLTQVSERLAVVLDRLDRQEAVVENLRREQAVHAQRLAAVEAVVGQISEGVVR